ncbi:MAG TPA: amidohydrolase [Ktedonobacterales bacterium]|jgi:hippurate hydrolase
MATIQQSHEDVVLSRLQAIYPDIEALYTDLHEHPELSMQEVETAKKVTARLQAAGLDVTSGVGGTGVVGVLRNGTGPTVMLRGDMDALPLEEKTGLPYASHVHMKNRQGETVPVMHACGHDVHTSCLVGTATLLAQSRQQWSGTLLIVAQPGEETMEGARAMLQDGLFTRFPKPDVALGQHTYAFPAGTLHYRSGNIMAAEHNLLIRLHGKGGHGALPQRAIDPVVMAAAIVTRLQTIVAREITPGEMAVLTVGAIHGGTRYNIIPDQAELQVTLRAQKDDVMQQLVEGVRRIVNAEASASRAPKDPEMTTVESTAATYNDATLTQQVVAALQRSFGADKVMETSPVSGSEDFSCYGHSAGGAGIPSCFWFVGVTDPQLYQENKGHVPSVHSPRYAPVRETALKVGIQALTVAALSQLAAP